MSKRIITTERDGELMSRVEEDLTLAEAWSDVGYIVCNTPNLKPRRGVTVMFTDDDSGEEVVINIGH